MPPSSASPFPPAHPATGARGRILLAARRHFLAHGFRGVTMDDLAAGTGMSKKTLYRHFPGKLSLLDGVLEAKWRELDGDLAEAAGAGGGDFRADLKRLLAVVQRHSAEVQPAFLRDMQREAPDRLATVIDWRRALIRRHFGRLLRAGRRAGMVRRDLSIPLMIELLTGTMDAVIPGRLDALGMTLRSALDAIVTLFFEGVIPRPERELP